VSLDQAEVDLENAQRAYDDARSRADNSASAVTQAYEALQSAQTRLQSAQISYDAAAQRFNDYAFTLAEAENAVIEAEIALERAQTGGGVDPNAQRTLLSTQLSIDQVNADIARSSLYAPIDAEVLEVNIQPGDAVNAFDVVIRIGLPEPKEASASLPIGDAQRLSVGLVGVCQVINQPESAVQCVVRQIPLNAQEADQTTRVAATLEGVTTNQIIEIQMPLQVREAVLWLPPAAIRTFQNRTFVVLETPDGPRSVDVQIGLRTDERVEIISGVEEGDVVQGP
jgi:multidrug efflux pump subunit AcrA (membrane-fusion protein)